MCDEDFCVVIFEAISAWMVSWYRKIIECCIDKKYIIVFLKGGGGQCSLSVWHKHRIHRNWSCVSYYISILLKSWSLHCTNPSMWHERWFFNYNNDCDWIAPVEWLDRPFEWLVWMGFNRWKNMWYVSYIALNEGLSLNCSACTAV